MALPSPVAGRYDVLQRLGGGAAGEVFRVLDREERLERALKVVRPSRMATPAALVRAFHREFEALTALRHTHLVRVHDVGTTLDETGHEVPWFTMDLVAGRPIDAVLVPPHDWTVVARLADAVLDALGELHAAGFVHGDVTAANILVGDATAADPPPVWLMDLGLADRTGRAEDGVIRGTPATIAPESLRGGAIDGRADLYALGCVLYRVVTGQDPFSSPNVWDVLRAHLGTAPTPPRLLAPELPPSFQDAILALLAKDPSARPATAAAARALLAPLSGRGVAAAAPLRAPLAPALAGRERELALFGEACARLTPSRGEILALLGAPGAGRTRLLEEFRIAARLSGLRAVLVRADRIPRRPLGLIDALLAAPDLAPAPGGEPDGLSLVERLLLRLAAAPAVLLVDDAGAADAPSQEALAALAERIREGGVPALLVLGLAEAGGGARSDDACAEVLEAGLARVLRLKPLDEAAAARMAGSMLGQAVLPAAWGRALIARTGGLPVLVEALVAAAVAARRVGPGAVVPDDPGTLLDGLPVDRGRSREWLERHWATLDAVPRSILAALAVAAGEALPFAGLERLEPHAARDAAAIDALIDARLVRRVEDAQGEIGLALGAPALAADILAWTPRGTVEALHRRRAEALEGRPGREATRARHLLAAGERAAAVDLFVAAAGAAHVAGLPREAVRLADEALGACGAGDAPPPAALRRLRAAALAAHGAPVEADAEFDRALAAARAAADPLELAETLRLAGAFRAERDDAERAARHLEDALALLDDLADLAGGARVLLELGALLARQGRASDAEARLASALNQARRAARPDLEADALLALGELAVQQGRTDQAGEHFRAAEAAAGRAPAARAGAPARRGRILALEAAGRVGDALDEAQRLLEEAREAAHRESEADALALTARLQERLGRRSAAAKGYEDAAACRRRLGQEADAAQALAAAAQVLLDRGQVRAALDAAQSAAAAAQRAGSAAAAGAARWARASIEARLGHPRGVEDALAAGVPAGPAAAARRALVLGEAHRIAGQLDTARGLLQEACFHARRAGLDAFENEGLLALAETYVELRDPERMSLALRKVRQAAEGGRGDELLARAQLVAAELDAARGGTESATALGQAQLAAATLAERERGDLAWRAFAALAAAAHKLGDGEGAARAAGEAARRVDGWLLALPEADRERFAARPAVRAVLERARDVRSAPDEPASTEASPRVTELERLLELNRALNSTLELRAVLTTVIDTAIELTAAERGFVLLEDGGRTAVEMARGAAGEDLAGTDREASRAVARRVMQDKAPLLAHDALTDERLSASRSIHALKIQSIVAQPLFVRGELAGAIVLDSRRAAGMFERRHEALLEQLAEQAGIAVGNARLVDELRRRAEEIRHLNERLSETVEEQRIEILEKQSNLEVRFRFDSLIGAGPAMQKTYRSLDKIVPTVIPVLVTGESGTGKDLVARVLHYNGPRREQRFVTVNCAALTDTLLESELFGHRKGAFTGADRDRKGLFEQADHGTLFLDEIGEMPLHLQPKLLRAIQFGEVRRVGEDTPRHVDVRIVAATNRDLAVAVKAGTFREDLLYRLDVARVHLAPLRERMEDIGLLVDHFLEQDAAKSGTASRRIEPAALRLFLRHAWPGNVRELEHEVMKIAAFCDGPVISELDVLENGSFLERARGSAAVEPEASAAAAPGTLEEAEIEQIRQAMRTADGNRTRAAEILGIDRSTLYRKLRRLGDQV